MDVRLLTRARARKLQDQLVRWARQLPRVSAVPHLCAPRPLYFSGAC
jgi:hypothetical protein